MFSLVNRSALVTHENRTGQEIEAPLLQGRMDGFSNKTDDKQSKNY